MLAAGLVAAGATACNDTTARTDSGHAAAQAKSAAKAGTAKEDAVRTDGEPGVPTCAADDLKVHLGKSSPGAGNIYVPLVFTNTATVRASSRATPECHSSTTTVR